MILLKLLLKILPYPSLLALSTVTYWPYGFADGTNLTKQPTLGVVLKISSRKVGHKKHQNEMRSSLAERKNVQENEVIDHARGGNKTVSSFLHQTRPCFVCRTESKSGLFSPCLFSITLESAYMVHGYKVFWHIMSILGWSQSVLAVLLHTL